jgi:RimJ/RimL family protein N-acetyltransferase
MYFKKIVGKRCYLSPIDENDSEKYTQWLNDLEVTQYLSAMYPRVINVKNEKEFLEKLAKEHNYAIIDTDTNELLGNCGFTSIDNLNQTSEIGIFIGNKNFWNKGYGTEAMTLLIDFGFKVLNLHNISLRVVSFNPRAKKVYEKIGFNIIGKRRESILKGKERYDMIYMDILYNDFYEKNKL